MSVFVWTHVYVQDNLMVSLATVLTSTAVPPNILQTLLNLAEFMEHEVSTSAID